MANARIPSLPTVRSMLGALWGVRCLGCRRGGDIVCDPCWRSAGLWRSDSVDNGGAVNDGILRIYRYDGIVRDIIIAIKRRSLSAAGRRFTTALAGAIRGYQPECVVLVPDSTAGWRRRGFGVVRSVLTGTDIRIEPALVMLDPGTQEGRTRVQRRVAREGALAVAAHWRVCGKRVVLVDDVATTGSTLHEARRALEEAGATVVAAIAIAGVRR